MATNTLTKCRGLFSFQNQLSLPEGALLEAKNVVINRDNVIESRRGFETYGNSFGTSSNRINQILSYKERIIRHYSNVLQYDSDGSGTFSSFSGSFSPVESGLRIKGLEANGNFYFTSSEGIKKISVSNANELSNTSITNSGGIKALDGKAILNSTEGFFTQDAKVAYRIVWGIKDSNQNLILGTPSERIEISNPLVNLLINDFNNLLVVLDSESNSGGINDGDYVSELKLSSNASASTIKNNLLSLCDKIDDDTVITEGTIDTVEESITSNLGMIRVDESLENYLSVGDYIQVNNFVAGAADMNGYFKIKSFSTHTHTNDVIQFDINHIDLGSQAESNGTLKRLKYTLNPFREITSTEMPVASVSAEIKSSRAYITFANDISSYVQPGDEITLSGFTSTGLELLNGVHTINGIQKTTNPNDTIQIDLITSDVISTSDTGGKLTTNDSELNLTLSTTATTEQQEALQNFYDSIVDDLKLEPSGIATDSNYTTLNAIKTSTVDVSFTIPDEVSTANFYQIFRSPLSVSTGVSNISDITPSDEMNLVYESNPTLSEISAKTITIHDILPDDLREGADYLYTNPTTGEGIAQANELPPLAKDITYFKNYIFYGNTQTRHRLQLDLLGTSDLNTSSSYIKIGNATQSVSYRFSSPKSQINQITCIAGSNYTNSGTGDYFDLFSSQNVNHYRVWFKRGTAVAPSSTGMTLVEIDITGSETNAQAATKVYNALNIYSDFIVTEPTTQIVTIQTSNTGITNSPTTNVVNAGFNITTTQAGAGEDATNYLVELPIDSTLSISQKIDICARSLVRVINKTASNLVYAYYISGSNDIPGKILLEARSLSGSQFYVVSNDSTTGAQFEPNISPKSITNISAANPSVITSATHGLSSNDKIFIISSNSTPSINGLRTVIVLNNNTFTVPVNVTVSGNTGIIASVISDNEAKKNRLYYSKYQQPEAVPLLNYIPIGPEDKEIVRILGLRDSLFILKEEGIYRLSGDSAPFTVTPFDFSTAIKGPDSAIIMNNQVYMDSNQGIAAISETGVSIVSRAIENLLLKLTNYTNFNSASFGVSYESDRSYLFWTVTQNSDTVATQCFRYNTFTNTWTLWDKSASCGLINSFDNKLYIGSGDINYVEQERKNFLRTDYSDKSIVKNLTSGSISGTSIRLNTTSDVDIGDILEQVQYLTINQFNRLLKKLDNDVGVNDTDYYSTLVAINGCNLRTKVTSLANKLDADSGVTYTNYASSISSYTSSFVDTQSAFNVITAKLNLDPTVTYNNYKTSTGTVVYEIDITNIDNSTNTITVRNSYPFIEGTSTLYKRINTSIIWAPQTLGDVTQYKQAREGTFLFENDAFIEAIAGYSSDLSPDFEEIEFSGSGTGIWGSANFGTIYTFGGSGISAPFRTLVPRNKQRCRFIKPKFKHNIARENFAIYGISITWEAYSVKAYR